MTAGALVQAVLYNGNYYPRATVTSYEASAISADPVFVTNFTDFHLQATSPAKTAGTSIAIPLFDITGYAVSATTPSLGAYEYH
jgi:hypothetical protein